MVSSSEPDAITFCLVINFFGASAIPIRYQTQRRIIITSSNTFARGNERPRQTSNSITLSQTTIHFDYNFASSSRCHDAFVCAESVLESIHGVYHHLELALKCGKPRRRTHEESSTIPSATKSRSFARSCGL